MNGSLTLLEMAVVALGLGLLVLDWWAPDEVKPKLGYAAAAALGLVLLLSYSHFVDSGRTEYAFHWMYVQDPLALYFKRLFLAAGIVVLVLSTEVAGPLRGGIPEYCSLIVFALAGMMFAASANDFSLLFVAMELITVTFYVLTGFQRHRLVSLEAGVKYLIIGALASAFLVFGIALVFGTTGKMNFEELASVAPRFAGDRVFLAGVLLVLAGLGFKTAVFPMQIWAPDVYQGAPTPTTAFLAIGSKAAGFALLLRVLFTALPDLAAQWTRLWIGLAAVTILYGNLCAIPQRNLKRLLGYSSIAHAGYLMLGIAAVTGAGASAVLFYLGGYLFTVLAAFSVIAVVFRELETEDIGDLAGLGRRAPFLAATLALAMISLAGIPPLVGFVGKFVLLKAVLERGATDGAYYWLVAVALAGVLISLYYYLGVVRAIYWSKESAEPPAVSTSRPLQWALGICVAAMLLLGIAPGALINLAAHAAATLNW